MTAMDTLRGTVLAIALAAVGAAAAGGGAARAARPPALTREQKLELRNAVQAIQIAQLEAQAAQARLLRAAEEAQALFRARRVEGWDLDLETLEYRPAAAPGARK